MHVWAGAVGSLVQLVVPWPHPVGPISSHRRGGIHVAEVGAGACQGCQVGPKCHQGVPHYRHCCRYHLGRDHCRHRQGLAETHLQCAGSMCPTTSSNRIGLSQFG